MLSPIRTQRRQPKKEEPPYKPANTIQPAQSRRQVPCSCRGLVWSGLGWFALVECALVEFALAEFALVECALVEFALVECALVECALVDFALVWPKM